MPATRVSDSKKKDPDYGQGLRRAIRDDIAEIVEIHQLAFRDHFLTQLGPGFLQTYYETVHAFSESILMVSVGPRGTDGFVAGFMRPEEFYDRMIRNAWRFGVPVMFALARRPTLARRVLYNMWKLHKAPPGTASSACELSSVAVRPAASGRGIGKQLVTGFLELAWTMGADEVYLTTDANDNDGTNLFYSKLGFLLRRTFKQHGGRLMNEYVIRSWPTYESGQAAVMERLRGRR